MKKIKRNFLILLSWIPLIQCALSSQILQFLPSATSFTRRTDQFKRDFQIPISSRRIDIGDDFFSGSSPGHTEANFWYPNFRSNGGIYHYNSLSFSQNFNGHITPDFSDGLSYPDPFLRTGIEAKRRASYLYKKELFFHDIPHVKGLLYNQEERRNNGLTPHRLGSLRPSSPWYIYKDSERFGRNYLFT